MKDINCKHPLPPYKDGLVLRGYDLVEYFNQAGLKTADPIFVKGIKGTSTYRTWLYRMGAKYEFWFVNKNNLIAFKSDFNRYLPQYGGFCSFGWANEYKPEDAPPNCKPNCDISEKIPWTKFIMGPAGEPSQGATIYRGKLYLNHYEPGFDYKRCFFYQKGNLSSNLNCKAKNCCKKPPTESITNTYIRRGDKRWKDWFGNIGPFNTRCFPANNSIGITDISCISVSAQEKKCLKKKCNSCKI